MHPSAMSAEMTLKTRILDQAHQVVRTLQSTQERLTISMMVLVAAHIYRQQKYSVSCARYAHKQKVNIRNQQANYTRYHSHKALGNQ